MTAVHHFFTFWVVLLIIAHRYTSPHIDLLYLSFVTMIMGIYLSYIHPRYYKFDLQGEHVISKPIDKFLIIDLVFHILAFVYIATKYGRQSTTDLKFTSALAIFSVYMIVINSTQVYHIRSFEILTVFTVANLMYILWQNIST